MQKPGLFRMNGFMVFLLTCLSFVSRAQQTGFLILLETENKQPFTVRLGDTFFTSSATGHLALSHLKDSLYRLEVRFPKKGSAEWVFPVLIHQRDQGFQLKGNDTAWVLYNWQTRETIPPAKELDSNRILDRGIKREDGFSKLMAAVVNDSSVMYNTYSGAGFGRDSSLKAESLKPKADSLFTPKAQGLTPNAQLSTANPPSPVNAGSGVQSGQPSTVLPSSVIGHPSTVLQPNITPGPADKKARKDSLLAARKTGDSLLALYTAAKRDSAIYSRRVKDSLTAVHKAHARDSLQTAKRISDSLLAVSKAESLKLKAETRTSPAVQPSAVNRQLPTVLPPTANHQPPTALPPTASGQPPMTTSEIKKLREVSLKISRKMVFLDIGKDGQTDTITLFVYFETADSPVLKKAIPAPVLAVKKPVRPDSTDLNSPAARYKLALKASESGCGQLATEPDLEYLRSAILKSNTEQDKISLASGAFGQKCFSVSQIRVLAGLFVSDKARYRLMEAAHLHIADPEHFRELSDMYTDKNFQRKFLAMADKRS